MINPNPAKLFWPRIGEEYSKRSIPRDPDHESRGFVSRAWKHINYQEEFPACHHLIVSEFSVMDTCLSFTLSVCLKGPTDPIIPSVNTYTNFHEHGNPLLAQDL